MRRQEKNILFSLSVKKITVCVSSLPPLKQKLWGNFHDYERALVTTEQEKQCVGETPFSLRIVENIRFCHLFFLFLRC